MLRLTGRHCPKFPRIQRRGCVLGPTARHKKLWNALLNNQVKRISDADALVTVLQLPEGVTWSLADRGSSENDNRLLFVRKCNH